MSNSKVVHYATLTGASSLLQLAQAQTTAKQTPTTSSVQNFSTSKVDDSNKQSSQSARVVEDDDNVETIFISQDQTVEIPGQNMTYVLITTANNEQQLVPVSKIITDPNR